jgi:hypothetical protein
MPIYSEKIPSNLIDELKNAYDSEVLNCDQPLLRQGDRLEVHNFVGGAVENGLLQSHINLDLFPRYSRLLTEVCTHPVIKSIFSGNEQSYKLIQTMVFHLNPQTSLHTDDIYLDSNPSGSLKGLLIALEDFSPQTGGLGVYEFTREEVDDIYKDISVPGIFNNAEEIYELRGRFLKKLMNYCSRKEWSSYYPKKGEVVYWDTWMPHFSILPTDTSQVVTRFSCAAHYIPKNTQFGTRLGGNTTNFAERFRASSIDL